MEQNDSELGENAAAPPATQGQAHDAETDFDPVPRRERHDGWTPDKQVEFIDALSESGCITEACARVGMSASSAYKLRRDIKSMSFRNAWDAALDHAVSRLSDAVFSRALNGVSRPVFFQGEQIGERVHYDERLAMFLLRYRDPLRYGKFLDRMTFEGIPAGASFRLFNHTLLTEKDAMMAQIEGEDDWEDEGNEEAEEDGGVS